MVRAWVSRNDPFARTRNVNTSELMKMDKGAQEFKHVVVKQNVGEHVLDLELSLEKQKVNLQHDLDSDEYTREDRFCVVVRFKQPAGQRILVRYASGALHVVGHEQMLFSAADAGLYTARFWLEKLPDQGDNFTLEFINLDDFLKNTPDEDRFELKLNKAPNPDERLPSRP